MKVAISKRSGQYIADSPANPLRGLETARGITEAKRDFADQAEVDAYVAARGGPAGEYVAQEDAGA